MTASPVALVTAGSAGLGAATARLLAKEGMRVVINYSANEERAAKLAEELSAVSPTPNNRAGFTHIRADLGKRQDINILVDETIKTFGRLDVVFSNGGWTRFRDINNLDENMDEEDWDRCFNMNVKSHLFLMHATQKYLDQTKGVFITTSSLAGCTVSGSSLAYSVTKAAQIHLVKGLAKAAGPNIRVNSVSPGLMLTDWTAKTFTPERQEQIRQKTALKELVRVEDVAEQVLVLVKSKSTTGFNAVIDAGQSL